MYNIPSKPDVQASTLPLPGRRHAILDPSREVPPELRYLAPARRRRHWVRRVFFSIAIGMILYTLIAVHRLADFGAAISPQSPFSTQTQWMGGAARINMVILSYGGPGHDGPYLTDSLLVISYLPTNGSTALLSVPRDLWVQVPPNSGNYAKLNTAYAYGYEHGGTAVAGTLASGKVSTVLGIAVPYWVSIDFGGFERLIDAAGGVNVDVPAAFDASYSPNYTPSQHFAAGMTHMDGVLALAYARARYCIPAVAAGDFARSARQQQLVMAIANNLRSPALSFRANAVMDALQPVVASNLSLADLVLLFTKASLSGARHIELTTQNVLQDAQSNDGQDILLPQNDDWSTIITYVQAQLGG